MMVAKSLKNVKGNLGPIFTTHSQHCESWRLNTIFQHFFLACCILALGSMAAPPLKLATSKGSGMHQKKMSNPESTDGLGENEGKRKKVRC